MDNYEKKLQDLFNENIELPHKYKCMVRNTLEDIKKRKKILINRKFFNVIATVCGCALIMTTVVFAKNYYYHFFNNNEGMDKAIESGYIEETSMKYIQSNGTEAKVENYLMDDFNLSFTIDIKLQKDIDVEKIARARVSNFIITDEENRIIYCDNKEIFDEYVKENNLDYSFGKFNDNYIGNGVNLYIKERDNKNNSLKLIYNLSTNKYPRSKVLNFKFLNINLSEQEINENEELVLTGEWKMNLEVPEKFYNRECIVYKVKNCSNPNINITEVAIYDTCMKFGFSLPTEKIYNDGDSEEEIKKKIHLKIEEQDKRREEIIKKYEGEKGEIGEEQFESFQKEYENALELFSKETYVETESGKKYYPTDSTAGNVLYSDDWRNGKITYSQSYNLTKNDATNKLKIFLRYNPNYSGQWEDICIELER